MTDSSTPDASTGTDEILRRAAARPLPEGSAYAGAVTPEEAHLLFARGAARIVDVRTAEELEYVGRIPETAHVPWRLRGASAPNPDFLAQLRAVGGPQVPVLFLCRSGQRSHLAAILATQNGFQAYNILEGFEGDLDANGQRGRLGGWRSHGLPWVQS